MGAAPKIIDKKTLQILVPFNALSPMHFNEVAQKTVVEEVRAGRLIFKEGDRDNQSVYLLEGEINLVAGNEIVGALSAGSDASRHPIAQQQPRQVSARAKSNVVVARVDSSLLDIMLTWDQSSGYEVAEISEDDDDDWMTRILQSQAFLKLPPSNIQRLLMRVESVPVAAGDVIIRQGGDGDYFYIIKNGRCMVTRKPSANAKEVKLAELADGDAFGEDALVSDAKRNATITMMTDGVLMRLAKKDFVELLKEPLLNKLTYQEALPKIARGAVWLDVRLPGEYENVHISGSRNIPLSALRLEANGLDSAVKYIVCCDTGRRSASAAFVLSQRGFEVYVLNEGMASVPAEALEGNTATASVAPTLESADIVTLKPQANTGVSAAQSAADSAELATLQARIDALREEKQALETAQQQLGGRVGALQEELERVRDESREQILELEQIIAEARQDSSAARSELQALQETLDAQRRNAGSVLEQTETLEAELTERRSREEQLQNELKALQTRAAELESAHQASQQQWAETDSERARLQARVGELQALADQVEAQRTQIATLEDALQQAAQQGDQTQSQQAQQIQRLGELEAALQVATAALERAHQDNEQRVTELQTARDQALQQAQADAAQQLAALQAQLDEAAAVRTELDARLAAVQMQAGDTAAEQQSLREALTALQAQLEAERSQLAEQRALAESQNHELIQVREAQSAALEAAQQDNERLRAELDTRQDAYNAVLAERDALNAAAADGVRMYSELQKQLQDAYARIEALQADAGTQVQQLQSELETVREQLQHSKVEQADLESTHTALITEREALRSALDEAQARAETLSAEAGTRVQQLQSELETVREQLQLRTGEQAALESTHTTLLTEREALQSALDEARARVEALSADGGEQVRQLETLLEETRNQARNETEARTAVAEELASAQTRAAELDAALLAQAAAAQALQDRLQAAEQALAATQAERDAQQHTHAALQDQLAELETRLAESQQAAAQAHEAQQAGAAALQTQITAQVETQTASDRQIAALEQRLDAMQTEAAGQAQEHQTAIAALQAQRDALQAELAGVEAARTELLQQQADAASGQDEQMRQLAQLREDLRNSQSQLRDADAARSEIESRMAEMSAAALRAQDALEQADRNHAEAVTAAEQRGRAAVERQVEELRSELEGARAALAREQSQRSNLEQATRAEFDAAQAGIAARLEQAERALEERQQAQAGIEAARQALDAQLAAERTAAADQQQALLTELEQLRAVTTADLDAMQRQMQQLQDDLKAARRLSAGGSADEEIERLRLLLDEAREEANSARADAEQWREHATSAPSGADPGAQQGAHVSDELAAMHIQLADVQSRVEEALQLRDSAQQELQQLRQAVQAQQQSPGKPLSAMPLQQDPPATRRGGLWFGLAAGLLLGAIGGGAALWFGGNAQLPVEASATPSITPPSAQNNSARAMEPVPTVKPAPVVAKPDAKPLGKPEDTGTEKITVSKGRTLQDSLPDGSRAPQLVEIAAAEFSMGSSANSLDFDERPRHNVKLRRYAISRHEVTFEEYDAFTRATGRRLPDDKGWGRGRQPVINVSWEEAVAYTQWLSEQTGRRYRLPTEAEWEYAAGGFVRSLYWWGNSPGEGRANCFNCASEWDAQYPAPVGRFAANPLGVYDTAGNVAEWVQDCYHAGYDNAPDDGSAWVEVGCTRRVVRGGGFNSPANTLRTSKRDQQPANMRADEIGFRVVREL